MIETPLRVGARSSTAPLRDVLVKRPGAAFGRAFDGLVETLVLLGVRVHELGVVSETDPDLVYVFDPLLIGPDGAIPLRPGKPNRRGEPEVLERWLGDRGVPVVGRIEAPGTVEGGDTVWLRDDLFVIGRSLRTNDAGARQLAAIVGGDIRIVDVPWHKGPDELIHLMSVISPVADDLAVVFLPLLPAGLFEWLTELRVRLIEVPPEEEATLGVNVLAVRPGVVVVADGNPVTRRALEAAGAEVHPIPLRELGENGNGGVTCLTRPLLREW
jgi:N-dimethylarginine dimethylaminohydrolase